MFIIHPLLCGTWILRLSNDPSVSIRGDVFLHIRENQRIELTHKCEDGIFGKTTSRNGYCTDHSTLNDITLIFTNRTIFSHSILGLQLPNIASSIEPISHTHYLRVKKVNPSILFIKNKHSELYYIFDLYIRSKNTPRIETRYDHFLFFQIIGFITGLILHLIFHL